MSEETFVQLVSGTKINAKYLAHAQASFLTESSLEPFLLACAKPLRTSVRVNTIKCCVSEFKTIAKQKGWLLETIPWCEQGFWLDDSQCTDDQSLGNSAEHIQGLFYIQEASSMLPPVTLFNQEALKINQESLKNNLLVMDMAAAPGSKTTQLAALLNNRGILLANELSASRLKSLHANLLRCGVLNTCLSHLDGRQIGELMPGQFDYILLDAPCGGEGTIRKDPHALVSWDINQVNEIAKLQKALILSAYRALKPGGRLVYSTCTLSLEENHQVANFLVEQTDAQIIPQNQLFKQAEKAITKEGYLHVLPHLFDSEGFFVACFSKPDNTIVDQIPFAKYKAPFELLSQQQLKQVIDYYQQHFGLNIQPKGYQLLQRSKEIWLLPELIESVNQFIKINRAGIQIAQLYPGKIRSTHQLAYCFGDFADRQKVALNASQASLFIQGVNIEIEDDTVSSGEVLLTFRGKVIGIGQNQKGKVKNRLPRALVKDNFHFD